MSKKHRYPCMRTEEREPSSPERRRFLKTAAAAGLVAGGVAGAACKKGGGGSDKKTGAPEATKETMSASLSGKPSKRPGGPGRPSRPVPAKRSKVVQVSHPKVFDDKGEPVLPTVQQMVDRAVMELTGKSSRKAAWSSLFSPSEKVGLKPNMLGRHLCWTHTATVAAIVAGLKSAGVKEENMYMWDLKAFDISPLYKHFRATKVHVKTTRDWGFGDTKYKIEHGKASRLVKPLEKVDAVVNIPVIKDHRLAGVTCAIKSVLGSVDNPREHHTNPKSEKSCDPMVPELSALPAVKNKMRLIVADAFRIIIKGGPRGNLEWRRDVNSVFAATDPVAMDRVAWTLIDEHRVKSKLEPLDKQTQGRPHIVRTAEKLGLGTADPKRIDHVLKKLG